MEVPRPRKPASATVWSAGRAALSLYRGSVTVSIAMLCACLVGTVYGALWLAELSIRIDVAAVGAVVAGLALIVQLGPRRVVARLRNRPSLLHVSSAASFVLGASTLGALAALQVASLYPGSQPACAAVLFGVRLAFLVALLGLAVETTTRVARRAMHGFSTRDDR